MKTQLNSNIKAHLLRGAFYLFLIVAVCVTPFALAQRNASKQRVAKLGNSLPTTIIKVTNTNDSGPGSLRAALAIANDGDTIDATGASGTILLTTGELQVTHNVTINGPGAGNLAVDGNATFRVFDNIAWDVTISGFTITNGSDAADGDGGGGILNQTQGTLTVSNCVISRNSGLYGGGIFNEFHGTVAVSNCTISGNVGGGIGNIAFDDNATLIITNSTISGNSALRGGGIVNGAFGSVPSTAFVTVSNSTLSGNSVTGDGGAIANRSSDLTMSATVMITNSTITDNSATGNGGGIDNEGANGGAAEVELSSTILKAGSSGENIFNTGTITSLGYNLSSDDGGGVLTGPGDQINTDPMLGLLQDNGGLTYTHELLPGSPAINAGDPSFTPPPDFDQRGPGFPRVVNARIDIGSFEVQCPSIWVERALVPYAVAGIFAVSEGTYVYVGGGATGDLINFHDDLWQYDPRNDAWTALAPSPDAHALSQAVYFNGKIYDIGGWVSASATTDVTRIYDISTNTWTTGAPIPVALGSMATMVWKGVIYVAGGYEPGIGVVNTLYAYDIASNTWTTLEPMPQALNYPGFGVINGKLYIAGGTTPCCYLNTLYIYDIATDTWATGENLPQHMRGSGCTVLNGELYLYGGQLQTQTMTNTTWIYNPGTGWRNGPSMNVSRGFLYGTAAGENGIVAPGGLDANFVGLDDNEQLINTSCTTPTPTPTPTVTPTPTPIPTVTVTPTPTPTATATPRAIPRPRPTPHPRPTPQR